MTGLTEILDCHLPEPGSWQPFPEHPRNWPETGRSQLRSAALKYLGTPWPALPASLWLRFTQHGERVPYERPDIARLRRLVVMALAADLDEMFIDDVLDGVWAVCEQTSWCLPAHDWTQPPGTAQELPDPGRPFVDLFAAETAALLGWVDHLLGTRLPAVVRRRVAQEVRGRVLEPYLAHTDWVWYEERANNWNPWIHANLVCGALNLAADRRQLLAVVDRAVRGVQIYLDRQPADGACDEGLRYWWRSIGCVVELLEWLRRAGIPETAGLGFPRLAAAARYPLAMHLGGEWSVNLADGDARAVDDEGSVIGYPAQLLYLLGSRLGRPEVVRHALALRTSGLALDYSLGRVLLDLDDDRWNEAAADGFPYLAQSWMAQTQVLTARYRAGSEAGPFLAVKGGHNAESHNHNDVGSVVVGWDGLPLAVDVGAETYDDDSFRAATRYLKWGNRSRNHNVPLVNGCEQVAGAEYRATSVSAIGTEESGHLIGLSLDLEQAYPARAGVRRLRRRAVLDRARRQVVLQDDWDLTACTTGLGWTFMLRVRPRALGDAQILLDDVVLRFDPCLSAGWTRTELTDHKLRAVWGRALYRLTFTDTTPRSTGSTLFTFETRH